MSHLSDCTGRPFAAGSVLGVRAWGVDSLGRLHGIAFQQVWVPGENLAECKARPTAPSSMYSAVVSSLRTDYLATGIAVPSWLPAEPSGAPCSVVEPGCKCGFYAYHDGVSDYVDTVDDSFSPPKVFYVHGAVEAYGKVTIGPRGFRASKARIKALWIPEGHSRDALIRRNYPEVPVFESMEALVRQYPPDPQLTPSPETDPEFWTRPVAS